MTRQIHLFFLLICCLLPVAKSLQHGDPAYATKIPHGMFCAHYNLYLLEIDFVIKVDSTVPSFAFKASATNTMNNKSHLVPNSGSFCTGNAIAQGEFTTGLSQNADILVTPAVCLTQIMGENHVNNLDVQNMYNEEKDEPVIMVSATVGNTYFNYGTIRVPLTPCFDSNDDWIDDL